MKPGIIFAASLLFLADPSRSFAQAETAAFKKFIFSDAHKGLINRAISSLPQAIFRTCPTLVSNGSQITVIKPVTIAASGFPNKGAWRESFPVSGCGNDTILNFYFTADSNEKINTLIAFPGTTRADLVLQDDAYKYASVGLVIAGKPCKKFYVKDTKFGGFDSVNPTATDLGPGERYRRWHETWTFAGCDRTFIVPISFLPSTKGTTVIPGHIVER